MPWQTPTLSEVRRQSRDGVTAALPGIDALPANSPARVLADNNAGLAFLCLLYLDWQSKNILPDTGELPTVTRWADMLLGGAKAATFADGLVAFTGLIGTAIPESTQLSASTTSGALLYETTEAATVGDVVTEVPVRALQPGAASNLSAGAALGLTVAISGVDASATVVALTGGTDAEGLEDLRSRVLLRMRKTPMGGDADDYVQWALEVPGVTRAWCSGQEMGIGTVTVRFMMDDLRADVGGFPTPQDCQTVALYLENKRPVTAKDLFVVSPVPEPITLRIGNLASNDASTLANIEASIRAMLMERAAPAYTLNGTQQPAQTIYASWVNEAILRASGVDHFTLTMDDHVMPSPGHMAVLDLGSIILD